jgi:Leucine-rich repeat (LRR) protein
MTHYCAPVLAALAVFAPCLAFSCAPSNAPAATSTTVTGSGQEELSPDRLRVELEKLDAANAISSSSSGPDRPHTIIDRSTCLPLMDAEDPNAISCKWAPNSEVDVAKIAGVPHLRSLSLEDTRVEDISALANAVELRRLNLRGTRVRDISALAKLTQLKSLDIGKTLVVELSPLAKLEDLEELRADATPIADLSALSNLRELRSLGFKGAKVSDLAPLAGLTNLETLDLEGCPVSDLVTLSALKKIASLDVRRTKVTDLGPLSSLLKLVELEFDEGGAVRFDALVSLKGLSSYCNLFPQEESCLRYPPTNAMIQDVISRSDSVRVELDPSSCEGRPCKDTILFETKARGEMSKLSKVLSIREGAEWIMNACPEGVNIVFVRGKTTIATMMATTELLVWRDYWDRDAYLEKPLELAKWLKARGAPQLYEAYRQNQEWEQANKKAIARWVQNIPEPLKIFWKPDAMESMLEDSYITVMMAALRSAYPDDQEAGLAILQWYGSGEGDWTGFNDREIIAYEIIRRFEVGTLVELAGRPELTDAQLEGATRFFATDTSRVLLPDKTRARLAAQGKKSPVEENRALAEKAFFESSPLPPK